MRRQRQAGSKVDVQSLVFFTCNNCKVKVASRELSAESERRACVAQVVAT